MAIATIKVDARVRDRLANTARARGMTMGALLDAESRRVETEERWTSIEAAYQRLCDETPDEWSDYLAELDAVVR